MIDLILDWWLFLLIFVFLPIALIVKAHDAIGRFRRRLSTSETVVSTMARTKDDAGAGYRRERREAMRHG